MFIQVIVKCHLLFTLSLNFTLLYGNAISKQYKDISKGAFKEDFTSPLRLQSLSTPQAQPTKHQLLTGPYHSTRSPLNKFNGAMEKMACGATSGEFLRCYRWHGSVAVCTGR
jgi:hypothetical protein